MKLEESPFLDIVPESRVRETLKFMGRSPDERLTPALAREVCQRQGVKAMIAGDIATLGKDYVINLNALNCQTGDTIATEQVEASGKEDVLKSLGTAGTALRKKLGESLASVRKFNAPLEDATTSSLEALQAYSAGDSMRAQGKETESIPYFKKAIELDPNFAVAYGALGAIYSNLGEGAQATGYTTKAYELRERVSERERFYILHHYYDFVTGQQDKVFETLELWKQAYPRDWTAPNSLAICGYNSGQFDKSLSNGLESIRLEPRHPFPYVNTAVAYIGLNKFDEAKNVLRQEQAAGLDSSYSRWTLYLIAFEQHDAAAMQAQNAWAKGTSAEALSLAWQADAAALEGKLRSASELYRQAAEENQKDGFKEIAASNDASEAFVQAEFGDASEARSRAAAALALAGVRGTTAPAAVALARAGDVARAEASSNDLAKNSPLNTWVNEVFVPEIRASVEIERKNPARAVELLRPAEKYELGFMASMVPVHLRGEAFLALKDGKAAAAEFQKVLDHHGAFAQSPVYYLAHLGLARAYALEGDATRARTKYQDFFALWKDADADLPILRAAKAEYEKLK